MREMKWIACLTSAALGAGLLCSCGDSGSESTAEVTEVQTDETVTTEDAPEDIPAMTTTTKSSGRIISDREYANSVRASKGIHTTTLTETKKSDKKILSMDGKGVNLTLDSDWSAICGADNDGSFLTTVVSYPAIFQYKDDPSATCTIIIQDGCEDEETFAANTEDGYIAAFGSEFDSLEISGFEFMDVQNIPSIKIIAKAVKNGVSFDMLHILSNNVNRNCTYSFMLLDADGSIEEYFDAFEERLSYPYSVSREDMLRERLGDEMYDNVFDEDGNVREEHRFNYKDYIK